MPGVFTHGDFDTWSPGYLMFIAAMHNGISRFPYETFGNSGSRTRSIVCSIPGDYARTWYRPNPPLPKVRWSQRDNNNYEQVGSAGTALNYFADNDKTFLRNFYVLLQALDREAAAAWSPRRMCCAADEAHSDAQRSAAADPAIAACRGQSAALRSITAQAPAPRDEGRRQGRCEEGRYRAGHDERQRTENSVAYVRARLFHRPDGSPYRASPTCCSIASTGPGRSTEAPV